MVVFNNILAGAAGQTGGAAAGYTIDRSIRLNSSDSAYLNRTPSSAGNRKTWTWAGWVKRSGLGRKNLFMSYDGSTLTEATYTYTGFTSGDLFQFGSAFVTYRTTTQVFRDPTAWYHFVIAVDTTQATANDRVKIYVNGTQITAFNTTNNPALNADLAVNATFDHRLGSEYGQFYFDGLLASVFLIDGQALDPTSFGEFDDNGIWQPIAYSGSYGTNGFHLDFADNSTTAALGTDASGNGNTWTVNNISVAAGAGNDSLVDVPTNGTQTDTGVGGEVVGNYATLNPLNIFGTGASMSNGNLDGSSSGAFSGLYGTIAMSSGKWYWEVTNNSAGGMHGIGNLAYANNSWYNGTGGYFYYYYNGNSYQSGNIAAAYGDSYTTNDVIGVAYDADNGDLYFYKNGVAQNSGTAAFTGLSGTFAPFFMDGSGGTHTFVVNFGQRPFVYQAPSGFKALNTANLPAPTIEDGSTVMDVVTYTGNGSSQTISGLGFESDLIWIKNRSNALGFNHVLQDSVRGFSTGKKLSSNLPTQEGGTSITDDFGYVSAVSSTGFSLTKSGTGPYDYFQTNGLNDTYVAWTWDGGSSTVSNTDGSITSSVRANASAGFSIVSYTGTLTSAGNVTIGHGLGAAPSLIITKSRSAVSRWAVFPSAALGANKYLELNTTAAVADSAAVGGGAAPVPTSTVFYTPWLTGSNINTENFVAYCFAPVEGYSAFGSYTGNGSTDGPFVYTGFRPRWVLIKRTDSTASWHLYDTARGSYNVVATTLAANESSAEGAFTSGYDIDLLSNGFKARAASSNAINTSGATYIYAAFAEHPFKTARAR